MTEKIKVLQVVGRLAPGGIENWLVDVWKNIDRDRFDFDFVTHYDEVGPHEETVRELGAGVVSLPKPTSSPIAYARSFYELLKNSPSYDIVHSHVFQFSGVIMLLSRLGGVPVRMTHFHTDPGARLADANVSKKFYRLITTRMIDQYSTYRLAASEGAASAYMHAHRGMPDNVRVLHCGIDLSQYGGPRHKAALRRQLGVPQDALVVGHVGRFSPEKNHISIVDTFEELRRQHSNSKLVLVGDGLLLPTITSRVKAKNLQDDVIMLGVRDDVPSLLENLVDVFLFPSLYEGLGLAVVEAQAAGLPCVVSDRIPFEADVVPELVTRMSLDASPLEWSESVLSAYRPGVTRQYASERALDSVKASSFNIQKSVSDLSALYQDLVERGQ